MIRIPGYSPALLAAARAVATAATLVALGLTPAGRPAAGAPATAAPPPAERERSDLLGAFRDRMRAGDLTGAAQAARAHLERFPDDGAMAYNLACVETRLGAPDRAWPALERALAGAAADPRFAAEDPDLAPLRGEPRFAALLAACRARLAREAAARGLSLREGYEGPELRLAPNDGRERDATWPDVRVRLTATEGGLTIAGRVRDARFLDRPQPWRNGDGFRVTLAAPPDPDGSGFDSDRTYGFGFGLTDNTPVGALVESDGRERPVTVLEIAPKVRLDADGTTAFYTIRIPWGAIEPYAPPLDTLLGINVSYLSVGSDRVRRVVSLVPDPALEGATGPWRRCAPLAIATSDRSLPALRGAVSNTLVEGGALGIRLVTWLPRAGAATLAVDVRDASGRSVVASGGEAQSVAVAAGLNRFQRGADLSGLPAGPYRVQAMLAPAGGDTLRWRTDVLRLEPDWLAAARGRAAALPPGDRPSLELRLAAIDDALARHHPRAPVAAAGSTVIEAGLLLRRAERSGTVLPDSGAFLAAYRDDRGTVRPCAVRLPARPAPSGPRRLLLLLGGTGAAARRVTAAIAQAMPESADVVVAAPELPPADPATTADGGAPAGDAARAAAAALAWARERFDADEVLLAGLDEGAAPALALSLDQAAGLARVLLKIGAGAEPWAAVPTASLRARLRAGRADLPYTIVTATAPPPRAAPLPPAPGQGTGAAGLGALMAGAGLRVEERAEETPAGDPRALAVTLARWAAAAD